MTILRHMDTASAAPANGVPVLTIADRLLIARRSIGLDTKTFAEATGISKATINNYESPTYERSRKPLYLRTWALACGVSYKWLSTGENPDPFDASDQPKGIFTGIPGNGVRYLTRAGDVGVPTVPPLAA
jgi:transcriptional regulator with XRE-family HTH domain